MAHLDARCLRPERARDELAGSARGLVLVTDGTDTSDEALDESIAASRPVVRYSRSASAGRRSIATSDHAVETPRATLKGTSSRSTSS